MLYLKIENVGVAPYAAFMLFGATSKRHCNNPMMIGTFGSGSKHSVGALLRANINIEIYAGLTKLSFYSKPKKLRNANGTDNIQQQVWCHISGSLPEGDDGTMGHKELSLTLDYGTAGWPTIDLACREFVSNAIDGQLEMTGDFKGVKVEIVDESKCRAKDGYTRVFLPLTEKVQEFYNNLGKWFLHFSEPDVVRKGIKVMEKKNRNRTDSKRAVIYRRGVYVRDFMASNLESIFDYNLDVELNEARTFNDWEAKREVARALRDTNRSNLAQIFSAIAEGKDRWELTLDDYGLLPASWENDSDSVKEARKEEWTAAAALVLGDDGVFCTDVQVVGEMVTKKGYRPHPVKNKAWIDAAHAYGVRTDDDILTQDDKVGRVFGPATDAVVQALDIVWRGLEKLGKTAGKAKPLCGIFTEPIVCESRAMGLYRPENKTVYAEAEYAQNLDEQLVYIMTEEVLHYVSGATDFSRDFQTLQTQIIGQVFYTDYKAGQCS